MKRGFFIYNKPSGLCITKKVYTDTPMAKVKLDVDYEQMRRLMPEVEIGVIEWDEPKGFSGKRTIVRQEPENVRGVAI